MSDMYSRIENVTPEMAREILEKNHGNRKIRHSVVTRLVGAIRRGEWRLSHQGIAIDDSGNLLDGQHRLHAIVESGITCELLVSRNVQHDAFRVMDQGARRTISDIAAIDKRKAEACSLAASLIYGFGVTFDQVEPVINSRIGRIISELVDYCGTTRRTYSSAPVKLVCAAASLRGVMYKDYAFSTYKALVHLDFDSMPAVAMALVRQEQNGKASATGSMRDDLIARASIVFDVNKKDLTKIQISDGFTRDSVNALREVIRNEVTK